MIVKIILWIILFGLLTFCVGFMNLVMDVREDKRIDRELRRKKQE